MISLALGVVRGNGLELDVPHYVHLLSEKDIKIRIRLWQNISDLQKLKLFLSSPRLRVWRWLSLTSWSLGTHKQYIAVNVLKDSFVYSISLRRSHIPVLWAAKRIYENVGLREDGRENLI